MLDVSYDIRRGKGRLYVEANVDGMKLSFENEVTSDWFWITFTKGNFVQFRSEVIEILYHHTDRELATFTDLTSLKAYPTLKFYLKESKKNGYYSVYIMDRPDHKVFEIELRREEVINLIDETTKFLRIGM